MPPPWLLSGLPRVNHGLSFLSHAPCIQWLCTTWQVYEGSGLATSPLTLPGAMACTMELFSFAKSYQMVGFDGGDVLGCTCFAAHIM